MIGRGWFEEDKVNGNKIITKISASHKYLGVGTHNVIFRLVEYLREGHHPYFDSMPTTIHIEEGAIMRRSPFERKALPPTPPHHPHLQIQDKD